MKLLQKYGLIPVLLLYIPLIILGIAMACLYRTYPLSDMPPTWGDIFSFITGILTLASIYLLYVQIDKQNEVNKVNRINSLLNDIPQMIETIRYKSEVGTEAIIEYGKDFNALKTTHPRVVIDKIQFIISQLELVFKDILKVKDFNEAKPLAQKALLLFYTNLYFTVTFEDDIKGTKGLSHKLENEYNPLLKQITRMQTLSYNLLLNWDLINFHKESNIKFKPTRENLLSLYPIYQHLYQGK